jgi:hypothetical protein
MTSQKFTSMQTTMREAQPGSAISNVIQRREEQEIKLVRDMNMNIVRSEGKLEDDY